MSALSVRRPAFSRGPIIKRPNIDHCTGVCSVHEDTYMTTQSYFAPVFAKTATALAILAATSAQMAAAQETTNLSKLVVTATTTEVTEAQSLTSVTVISKDDIKKQQPHEITELLAAQPGIDIVTNGGYGKSTSIFTRGSNSTGTKLLIDGVPIQSHSLGSASWQYLPISQVERIEIVRGPKSSLYGSSAAGGVVQVFLPEGQQGDQAEITLGAGSFGTTQTDASVSGSDGKTSYLLAVGTFDTDGEEVKEGAGDMGYSNDHVMARLGYEFDSGAYIKALLMHAEGDSEYTTSSGSVRNNDYQNQVLALTGGIDVTDSWQSEVQLRQSRDDYDVLNDAGIKTGTYYDSESQGVRWNNTLWLGDHEFVVGAEHVKDSFDGSYAKERTNNSVFAQSLSEFGPLSVQLNIRADHYDEYDTQTTGGVAFGYQLDPVHTLRVSGRTSFTAPTFNSMNAENWGYTLVNEIRPETSESYEVGIRGDYQNSYWDAAVYQADYDDLIAWTYPTVGNIEAARVQGLELAAGTSIEQWSFAVAATLMDTENLSEGAVHGNRLVRRANKSARIDVDRHFEEFSLGMTLASYGERFDDEENETLLPGYGVLNLRASYDFAQNWNAKFVVKNALDKSYQTAQGYNNPGVGAFLTVNYSAF
ncbi:Outer membrane cobalamin receptor protein [Marinomonas fungiae]|uniref:Outer membrane cobalamin receptor protein n=2 Tax=Marinomonas fungiae TaxID=1137284 RepID=A0A0K6IIQ9_9GAMM|nr:Outer membrane cobalamin receptor protein [Marinomonas fungiae]